VSSWTSYPKLWNVGHPNTQRLFDGNVRIEEKVDGSQFSFGVHDGILRCKSKRVEIVLDAAPDLFVPAIATVQRLHELDMLTEGWTYRAEAFKSAKHNSLTYDRMPKGGLILFDIAVGMEHYASRDALTLVARRLGLELVPVIFEGKVDNADQLKKLLDRRSVLGGAKIEGIAIKSTTFLDDGKPLYGKLVSEAFRETHQKDWKARHPGGKDLVASIAEGLRTEARWSKAIQRMRDAGDITDSPKDIGPLMKDIHEDIKAECKAEIMEALFAWAWKSQLQRSCTAGFPQWYKEQLLLGAFDE